MDNANPTLLRRLQKLEDYLFFSAAAAALGLAALAAYVLVNRAALKMQVAWAAPLTFLIAGGLLLGLFWQRQNVRRALARSEPTAELAPRAPIPLGLRLLLGAAALGYLALYALTAGVCLRAVYNNNHFAGVVFAIIYALLSVIEAYAAWELRSGAEGGNSLSALLLPGGISLARTGAFWLGFAVPLVSMGLQTVQLPQVNAFFQRNKPWALIKDVPDAAVLGLGLLYFLLLEGLLGQAASAWERLNRGEQHPFGKWAVMARWVLALLLAYPLGGLPLLVLSALLLLWQVLAFGRGAGWVSRRPGPALLLMALGPTLLFVGGTLTWLGSQWSYAAALAFAPVVYFLALAHSAGEVNARLETPPGADPSAESSPAVEPDPLRRLFLQTRLRQWRSGALAAAGFASVLLLVFLILAENCRFYNSLISPNFARCIPTGGGRMAYFELGPLNGALLAFDLLVLCLLVGLGLARLLRPLGGLVRRLPGSLRRWLGWALIGATVALAAVAVITDRSSWLAAAALARGIASAVRGMGD